MALFLLVITQAVKNDISQLVESQQELESSFEDAVKRKSLGAGDAGHNDVKNAAAELRNNAAVFAMALKQHPLATDNLEKVQTDRFLILCEQGRFYVRVVAIAPKPRPSLQM